MSDKPMSEKTMSGNIMSENIPSESTTSESLITSLTLDSLRDDLQQAGYRVETLIDQAANQPFLRTATAGVSCDIRPGNQLRGDAGRFADAAFMAIIQVAGDLPPEIVNRWNMSRRFARLQFTRPFLALCLDISVLNGVTPGHVRGQIAIFDQLVQDLVPFLRSEIAASAANHPPAAAGEPRGAQPSVVAAA